MSSPPHANRHWPGWDRDLDVADRHARVLARRLARRRNSRGLSADWQFITDAPVRVSQGDAESFLTTRTGKEVSAVIVAVLERIWRDGWVLGASAAWRMKLPQREVAKSQTGHQTPVRCDLGHEHVGHGAAGLLIRSRNEDGKRVFLLHMRKKDGRWLTPGGSLHTGEKPFDGAMREAHEEIGSLPDLKLSHQVVQDHGNWCYTTFVVDVSKPFTPLLDGETPEEVTGWAWFRKKDVSNLDLAPGMHEDWETIRDSREDTHVNSGMGKAWRYRRYLPRVTPAPVPPDPRRAVANRLIRAGVPRQVAIQSAGAFLAWEASEGAQIRRGIVSTLTQVLARILQQQNAGKITQEQAEQQLADVLSDGPRSARITLTEVSRASAIAARDVYLTGGVHWVRWVTARDAQVCPACALNAAAGPVHVTAPFPSGEFTPPAHPHCRCAIVPADAPPETEMTGSDDWLTTGKSAETAELSTVHRPLGHEGLWHTPDRHVDSMQQLPAYVQNVARALMRDGRGEQEAIATALNAIKEWAAGHAWGGRVKVTPQVRAAAGRAIAEWESLRASHHKCLTCGCHLPDHDHGDPRHVTLQDLADAADAANETVTEAVENIVDTLRATPEKGNPWLTGTPR